MSKHSRNNETTTDDALPTASSSTSSIDSGTFLISKTSPDLSRTAPAGGGTMSTVNGLVAAFNDFGLDMNEITRGPRESLTVATEDEITVTSGPAMFGTRRSIKIRRDSSLETCPNCDKRVKPRVVLKKSRKSKILAMVLSLLYLWPFTVCVSCFPIGYVAHHYCPKCGALMQTRKIY